MKARHLPACIAIALALLGCATERPTRPTDSARLPASSFYSAPVIAKSQTVWAEEEGDTALTLDFSGLNAGRDFDDVLLRCSGVTNHFPPTLSIYQPLTREWVDLEGAFPPFGGLCFGTCYSWADRLVSQLRPMQAISLIDSMGIMRISSNGALDFSAHLITYSDSYHFTTVIGMSAVYAGSLSYSRGALYFAVDFYDYGTREIVDSLISLDLEGNRRYGVEFSRSGSGSKSVFVNDAFSILRGEHLYIADSQGQVTVEYAAPVGWIYAMTNGHGNTWYVAASYADSVGVYRIDAESTAVLGSVVSQRAFSINLRKVDAMTADSSGFVFAYQDRLYRYSIHGRLLSIRESPVSRISGLAWDGESLWMLHHGPPSAPTDATLLSRFEFE